MTNDYPYGFRITGSPIGGERKLIEWDKAFTAHCELDERCSPYGESYLSPFSYDVHFRDYLKRTRSTEGYYLLPCASSWSSWLWFDIDRKDDLEQAKRDTTKLAIYLADRYRIEPEEMLIFYSGSKGFHLGIQSSLWSAEPLANFNDVAEKLALGHVGAIDPNYKIDPSIYTLCQPFRSPNSRHQKTGLFKRRIDFGMLLEWPLEAIQKLAKTPQAFEVPSGCKANQQAIEDWHKAQSEAAAVVVSIDKGDRTRLNRATMEFIRHGAQEGDRHRLLFSAAANLAELGCTTQLAHALLTEAGLDSALPPKEVERQIECGLRKGSR